MTFMIINRDNPPPSSSSFKWAFFLLTLLIILNYLDVMFAGDTRYMIFDLTPKQAAIPRQICAAVKYAIQPVIILLQLLIVAPSKRYKLPCITLAVINAAVFLPAAFGAKFAFYISPENHFHRGPIGYTIFVVLLIYVGLLYQFSLEYFHKNRTTQSLLLISLVTLAVVTAFGEATDTLSGHTVEVIIIGTLAYYLYLTSVHQHEMRTEVAEKKLLIAQQEMTILREQIQPHFIYNSLNIIRSLIRKDSRAAVESIDNFSDYLQAHFRTLRHDALIDFTQELDHVKAFLSLAEADKKRKTQIIYELEETDFKVPPLCLEPIVENAILHGTNDQDGIITIASCKENGCFVIEVRDNGTGESSLAEGAKKRVGIGVENTRRRLKLLCGGTLEMQKSEQEGGTRVRILIPETDKEETK